jgi:hypothetical protein
MESVMKNQNCGLYTKRQTTLGWCSYSGVNVREIPFTPIYDEEV